MPTIAFEMDEMLGRPKRSLPKTAFAAREWIGKGVNLAVELHNIQRQRAEDAARIIKVTNRHEGLLMEPIKCNPNKLAHLGRRSFCWLLAATVTFLAGRISVGGVCYSDDPARPADNPESSPRVTDDPCRHLCGRAGCPVSIDAAGNMWCWCRTVDIRDICD